MMPYVTKVNTLPADQFYVPDYTDVESSSSLETAQSLELPPVNYSTHPSTPHWLEIYNDTPSLLTYYNEVNPCEQNAGVKASVSDKKKFFEKAMEEHHNPSPKPERVFSFLSQDEVEKMKQEEEQKMGTLMKQRLNQHEQFIEEDDEDNNDGGALIFENTQSIELPRNVNSNTCVRTAKAEKRMKERLSQEGIVIPNENNKELSPSEQRSLNAEKKAAWRQARLKSLEQDALQAQLVIRELSEISESKSTNDGDADSDEIPDIQSKECTENKTLEVETTKEKIVSLELSTPESEIPEIPIEEAAEEDVSLEKKQTNPSGKKRRRKRTKSTDKQTT
uniref:Protein scribble n=2 Tax=Melanaphis sacchari TaxID=742174 RepID=A0A2H8TSX7_9HEMI